MQEREILYKLLFEMKSDLNDLKKLVFELIHTNDLSVSDFHKVAQLGQTTNTPVAQYEEPAIQRERSLEEVVSAAKPIIIDPADIPNYQKHEIVEETLSLSDMEREMIRKALKKHRNRRKDAAQELGISERTLYRKIKEYEL